MEATNHRFQKKSGKLWTFLYDEMNIKSQIDYILFRKKWSNSVKNTEAYNYFSSISSNHRVVVSRIQVSLQKTRNPPKHTCYDSTPLKAGKDLQKRYSVEVHKFSCLTMNVHLAENSDERATNHYEKLVAAVEHTNKTLLKSRPKRKWDDPACDHRVASCRTNLVNAKGTYHLCPSECC